MSLVPRLSLRWWLVLSHAAAIAMPVAVLLGSGTLAADLRDQTRWDLEHQGAILAMLVEREVVAQGSIASAATALGPTFVAAKDKTLSGVRLVDASAVVVASSAGTAGEDLVGQPEVEAALAGAVGVQVRPRPPPSSRQPLSSESRRATVRVFVATPVVVGGDIVGAVVLSRTPREEVQAMLHMAPGVLGAVVSGGFAAVGLAALAALVATRSLVVLGRGATRIAEGDLSGVEDLARPEQSRIAEVASTAASVTAMTGRLRERLAYIGEFASHVAHEFKTPLATLGGTFELLADDEEMPEAQRKKFLQNGAAEVDRLRRLVDGLLALARAEEVRSSVPVELGEVARDVAARHGVAVEGEGARVRGDRQELFTVVDNLVRNAFEHGGDAVKVKLVLFAGPDRAGVRVEDDGPGISAANVGRVFERFFTTRRDGGGTGLGLALVRAVTRRHGGDTTVESRPGHTVFVVELPRAGA
jgi:signal transduction histidine kinase